MTYRAHGDRDVKVLASIVLLEGGDVKPNLKNTKKHKVSSKPRNLNLNSC